MRWSDCVLQQVEDEELEKTRATFHQKPQPYGSMVRATDLRSWVQIQLLTRFFFSKINTFCIQVFKSPALIALLLGISSTHRNRTWAKLNARHLGTQLWCLLMDICFCSFFTVRWKHRCREKTKNSCNTFLSKPRRQTVVNQLSCGFNPSLSQNQFLDHFFQWSHLSFCFDT